MIELTPEEARIIGCLIEKSIVTPDQYPLTLNALTNACNQKSSRDPVMSLDPGTVERCARLLEAKNLLRADESFKSRTKKYLHRFCNSRYSDLQFDDAELAIVCLLLLRGPQTPGELRARSGRLHAFADNAAVTSSLQQLMEREPDALIARLPRAPGRKDSEYMHLFCGPIDGSLTTVEPAQATRTPTNTGELESRVAALESELATLKSRLADLLE